MRPPFTASPLPVTVTVLRTGPFCTVQDGGRPGFAEQGVPRSGAADRSSLALANRLVANPEGAPAFEVTFGGLEIEVDAATWLSTAGAPAPVSVDGREVGPSSSFAVRAGSTIRLARPERGLRTYLAVRGGLDIAPVLGSASEDVLSQIAPAPLTPGIRIRAARPVHTWFPSIDQAPVPTIPDEPVLELSPGPRLQWLDAGSLKQLTTSAYVVSPQSNRIGVRLQGPQLERAVHDELPPEGIIAGAVQLPPSGQPIIFLADFPTTGGYPVIAVVRGASQSVLAQLVPGQRVRLRLNPEAAARTSALGWEPDRRSPTVA